MTPEFVHLHLHTEYSLLDGASRVGQLTQQAKQFGMPAIAITDHGNLFGAISFYQAVKQSGLKPIIGCEVYMAPNSRHDRKGHLAHNEYHHLILLAADQTGYHNLIKLVAKAHLEGFYYKPRIDKELLHQHHRGLIALSGCLSGEVPHLIGRGQPDTAMRVAGEYQDLFGKDHYYLEIQANGLPEQAIANEGLLHIHTRLGIPVVGTNDCHYLHKDDAKAHDVLLCLQTGKTVNQTNRLRFHTNELYLKSSEEMGKAFGETPDALTNTLRIAERCDLHLDFTKIRLPQYEPPAGMTREQYLEQLARAGLEQRLREQSASDSPSVYSTRLDEELAILNTMGYAGYFLIVWDIINFARSRRIPVGPGRGSSAGSLVAYALRITDMDPLAYNLLFERFLNPERVTLPDIDMDFCMDRREEVINYVIERYGEDHVAQIITFGTLGAKAVVRDVGRVMEIPYADVDRVAKLIPNQLNVTLDEALQSEPQLQELTRTDARIKELITTAKTLEGLARHASTHAAGIVISDEPLMNVVPLFRGANGEMVTQFPMNDIEKIGLIKFDLLGLKTLTAIHHAVRLINQLPAPVCQDTGMQDAASAPFPRASMSQGGNGVGDHPVHEREFAIERIPVDDPTTYALLASGKTTGVFQLESAGMRDLLTRIHPESFEDLIAILALFRPGPIGSGMVDEFIKRKRGLIPITYDPPALEEILKETYGVIVYQEQVMTIANRLAGFSLGQADLLRRAMGKKKPEEMAKQKTEFIEGCINKGLDRKKAVKLFDLIAFFAGYGFNKSHSAAYAMITYQTAYLKAHYPVQFMAALMTTEKGNTDRIVRYLNDCRESGIPILPPDINESSKDFTVVPSSIPQESNRSEINGPVCVPRTGRWGIRFGLAAVKNVGEGAIESIIGARTRGGRFSTLTDLTRRVDAKKLNKRILEGLIKSGALDSLNAKRSQLMAVLDRAMDEGARAQRERQDGQINLFASLAVHSTASSSSLALPDIPEWSEQERLKLEKELVGFYITAHPLTRYAQTMKSMATATSETLGEVTDGKEVRLCGIVSGCRMTSTKKGERMATFQLEDLHGRVDVIAFPDAFKAATDLIIPESCLMVTGVIDRTDTAPKIKATKIAALPETTGLTGVDISANARDLTSGMLTKIKHILQAHPGSCPVALHLNVSDGLLATIALPTHCNVYPSNQCVADLEEVVGKGAVRLREAVSANA